MGYDGDGDGDYYGWFVENDYDRGRSSLNDYGRGDLVYMIMVVEKLTRWWLSAVVLI